MAKVRVPAAWLQHNMMPSWCLEHGDPQSRPRTIRALSYPAPWAYLGLILGVLPALAMLLATRKSLPVQVFECARCQRKRTHLTASSVLAITGSLVLCLIAMGSVENGAGFFFFTLILVCLAFVWAIVTPMFRPRAQLSRDEQWITWRGLDDAVAQQLATQTQSALPYLPVPSQPAPYGSAPFQPLPYGSAVPSSPMVPVAPASPAQSYWGPPGTAAHQDAPQSGPAPGGAGYPLGS